MTPMILKYALFILTQGLFFSTLGRSNWVVYIFTGFLAIVSTAFLASKELYGAFLDVVGIEAPADPSDCAAQDSEWALAAQENTCYAIRAYLRRHGDSQCYAVELATGRRDGLCQAYDAEQARLEAERRRLEQERLEAERRQREEQARQAEERRRREEEAERQRQAALAAEQARLEAEARERSRTGRVFRDFPGAPEMVMIPGGSYLMGSPPENEDSSGYNHERPQTRVTIRSFALGKYEVTFDEYDACAAAGACRAVPTKASGESDNDRGWGRGRRPVIEVNIEDAEKYIGWLNSQVDGSPYRLPSEAEWEYAARGGRTMRYPWGDVISRTQANYGKDQCCGGEASGADRWVNTAPVGSFPANGFGLHDMIGNVWEWTGDCWNNSYNGRPTDGSAWRSGDCTRNVIRGGSWVDSPQDLRAAYRLRNGRVFRYNYFGFRVARTLP